MEKSYELVAKKGDVTLPGVFTDLEDSPSINDSGFVAFVGRKGGGTDLFVADDSKKIT